MLSATSIAPGQRVWFPNPSKEASSPPFLSGEVVSANGTAAEVNVAGSSETRQVPESELDMANAISSSFGVTSERSEPDNCDLLQLSEATLLHNTLLRYRRDEIYTFTGPIVTSLNPCKPLPHLYSMERMKAAKSREDEELGAPNPHIYSVGEAAYKNLRASGRNQSIVVTGISGAGKTEANKYLLKFLCWRAQLGAEDAAEPEMARVVLESTPVFEAFGNATTVMNPNSSRFGKFMRVLFDESGGIAGANVSTYLLEKSRLAVQQPGEANFHIFYQLLTGLTDEALARLHLQRDPAAFHYLKRAVGSAAGARKGLDDKAEFCATDAAMRLLGLRGDEVFEVLAGILHLGNVAFELVDESDPERASAIVEKQQVQLAEQHLGMSRLSDALTVRKVQAGGGRASLYEVPQTPEAAARARDALTKRLYERLFLWIVSTINARVAPADAGAPAAEGVAGGKWIGLLDIFGFEIFKTNSLEQLLINLANEKLQRFFLDSIFHYEQAHYAAEEIEWVPVEVPDNGPIVAAIEELPSGVLALLDEQCWLGERGSDSTFCSLLNEKNAICSAEFAALDQKGRAKFDPKVNFVLAHFVAPVKYSASEFIEKNRDSLFDELARALAGSSRPLVQLLFPQSELASLEERARLGSGKSYGSVASKFGFSLTELLAELSSTDPGFIRTIKPNTALAPGAPDERLVLEQLRTCGMLQCVTMIRSMFPTRIAYIEVVARYRQCVASYGFMAELLPKQFTAATCEAFDVDPDEYRLGLTKLFIKGGCAVALNKLLRGAATRAEKLAQEALLRWKLRLWHKERLVVEWLMAWASRARARLSTSPIAPTTKHVLAYRALRRAYVDRLWKDRAASRIQARLAARKQRERYAAERAAAITVQAAMRRALAVRELAWRKANAARLVAEATRDDAAATQIQARARTLAQRAHYRRHRAAQARLRALAARALRTEVVRQSAATLLQTAARMHACRARYLRYTAARSRWLSVAARARRLDVLKHFSATRLQAAVRMRAARNYLLAFKQAPLRALIRLQALARGKPPRRRLRMAMLAVRVLQSIWRMLRIQLIRKRLVEAALVLQKGAVMLKYKQNGGPLGTNHEPHRRFIWLSKDMRNLCWSKPDEQDEAAKEATRKRSGSAGAAGSRARAFMSDRNRVIASKTIGLSVVSAISTGAKTEVLTKMDKGGFTQRLFATKKEGSIDENAFSIISPQRRLDLYAESTAEREAWSKALRVVLLHGHTVDTAYLIEYSRKQQHEKDLLAGTASPSSNSSSELVNAIQSLSFAEARLAHRHSSDVDEMRKLSARGTPRAKPDLLAPVPDDARGPTTPSFSAFSRATSFWLPGSKKKLDVTKSNLNSARLASAG